MTTPATELPSTYQLWYGRDEPPLAAHLLRAGPVTARLIGRDLRNVRYGGLEIVQRIYVAIRDRNWGTVPGEVSNVAVDAGADRFRVGFDVIHRQHDVDVSWRGEIVGAPDGTISYAMDATVGADLTYKLIGLNVHHGMREYAGRPYQGRTPDAAIGGDFPTQVEPQYVVDLTEVPIFPAVEQVTVQLTDDVAVRFDFEGDTFEFEDQRNWTDASFKSQSYPPRRNGFFQSRRGDRIWQKVIVTTTGTPPPLPEAGGRHRITIGAATGRALPPIGFGMASHGGALSPREGSLLRALRPDHLRVDLRLADPGYPDELTRAAEAARVVGTGLELALFATEDADRELADLAARLATPTAPIRRVLVFGEGAQATDERLAELARERLGPVVADALVAAGTNANFCELNRHRRAYPATVGIAYAITPQIHAFDELSLVENLAAQAETVATARAFGGERPIVVGPVTLKPRFNSVATSAEPELAPGELPAPVDPRQMSLFGAGWTVGSVKYLAESGVAAVTYFETTGWRGVIETDAGSPVPERFPSRPGMVFPVYHVFADLAEWRGGEVVRCRSDDPLAVDGLAVREAGALHVLLANLTAEELPVTVGPLTPSRVAVRRLNAETAPVAAFDAPRFRATTEELAVDEGELTLSLAPFVIARIDAAGGANR